MKLKIKSITEAKKSVSGNVKFVKKNILPMLKTIGVTSMKVNQYGDQLEVEFDINPEEFDMFKDKLKKKVGDKGSRKREKFNFQVFEELIRETIREELSNEDWEQNKKDYMDSVDDLNVSWSELVDMAKTFGPDGTKDKELGKLNDELYKVYRKYRKYWTKIKVRNSHNW